MNRIRLRPDVGPSAFARAALSALAAITLLGSMSAPVDAQLDQDRLRDLFGDLEVEQRVQLVTPEILVDDATFMSLEPSTVELRQAGTGRPISVDLTAIRGVAVQQSHHIQGMIWGLGAGLLVGSVSGLFIGSFGCTSQQACNSTEQEGAIRWGAVLGVIGGGLGFTLGRRDLYWKPIFP